MDNFTIGADPEFICCDKNNKIIRSDDYFDEYFGADGAGVSFELRPMPSESPLTVISNMHELFIKKILLKQHIFKESIWHAGSFYKSHPLGGHIHFGNLIKKYDYIYYCKFLDDYVGSISLLIDDKELIQKRVNSGYGAKCEFRTNYHGFEYRTIGSWLVSPYIAASMLCLAKTIIYEVLNNPKFYLKKYTDIDVFYFVLRKNILNNFSNIWNDITSMKLYQKYKPYIDLLYFLVKNKLTWYPQTDMKTSWGIIDMQTNNVKINPMVIWSNFNDTF